MAELKKNSEPDQVRGKMQKKAMGFRDNRREGGNDYLIFPQKRKYALIYLSIS